MFGLKRVLFALLSFFIFISPAFAAFETDKIYMEGDIEFNGYKAIAMVADNGDTLPTSANNGQWFYRSDIQVLFFYESGWKAQHAFAGASLYVDTITGSVSNSGYDSDDAIDTLQGGIEAAPASTIGSVVINVAGNGDGTFRTITEDIIIGGKSFSGDFIIKAELYTGSSGTLTGQTGTINVSYSAAHRDTANSGSGQTSGDYYYYELSGSLAGKSYGRQFFTTGIGNVAYFLEVISASSGDYMYSHIAYHDTAVNSKVYVHGQLYRTDDITQVTNPAIGDIYNVYTPSIKLAGTMVITMPGVELVGFSFSPPASNVRSVQTIKGGGVTFRGCKGSKESGDANVDSPIYQQDGTGRSSINGCFLNNKTTLRVFNGVLYIARSYINAKNNEILFNNNSSVVFAEGTHLVGWKKASSSLRASVGGSLLAGVSAGAKKLRAYQGSYGARASSSGTVYNSNILYFGPTVINSSATGGTSGTNLEDTVADFSTLDFGNFVYGVYDSAGNFTTVAYVDADNLTMTDTGTVVASEAYTVHIVCTNTASSTDPTSLTISDVAANALTVEGTSTLSGSLTVNSAITGSKLHAMSDSITQVIASTVTVSTDRFISLDAGTPADVNVQYITVDQADSLAFGEKLLSDDRVIENEHMRITDVGFVGIGTTAPATLLETSNAATGVHWTLDRAGTNVATIGSASTSLRFNVVSGGSYLFNSSSLDNDFKVNWDTGLAFFVQGSDGGVFLYYIKSGATQGAAGAATNELWSTSSHATLPDGVVMRGL